MIDLIKIHQSSVGKSKSGILLLIISFFVIAGFYLYSQFMDEDGSNTTGSN